MPVAYPRVLLLTIDSGEPEQRIVGLADALDRSGWEVRILGTTGGNSPRRKISGGVATDFVVVPRDPRARRNWRSRIFYQNHLDVAHAIRLLNHQRLLLLADTGRLGHKPRLRLIKYAGSSLRHRLLARLFRASQVRNQARQNSSANGAAAGAPEASQSRPPNLVELELALDVAIQSFTPQVLHAFGRSAALIGLRAADRMASFTDRPVLVWEAAQSTQIEPISDAKNSPNTDRSLRRADALVSSTDKRTGTDESLANDSADRLIKTYRKLLNEDYEHRAPQNVAVLLRQLNLGEVPELQNLFEVCADLLGRADVQFARGDLDLAL